MRLAGLAFLVVVSVIGAAANASAQQPGHPAEACVTAQLQPAGRPSDGIVPVIMVHGWTSSASIWDSSIDDAIDMDVDPHGRSMSQQLQRIPGSAVWSLDYHEYSARWVTDQHIAASLAEGIACLSEAYGFKVVLVGHSMGGLAARQALAELEDPLASVAGVVTFGTPHAGSDVAAVFGLVLDVGEVTAEALTAASLLTDLVRACGQLTTQSIDGCEGVPAPVAAFDSGAGKALRSGSDQLAALPGFPAGLPVRSIAGEIRVVFQESTFGIFYRDIASLDTGDLIVSSSSATNLGDGFERDCQLNIKSGYAISDDFRQLIGIHYDDNDERAIVSLLANPCMHTQLTGGVELTNEATGYVFDLVEAELATLAEDALARLFVLYASRRWNLFGLATTAIYTGPEGTTAPIDPQIVIDEALAAVPETPDSIVESVSYPGGDLDVYPKGCAFAGDVHLECYVAVVDSAGNSTVFIVYMVGAAGRLAVDGIVRAPEPVTSATPLTIRGLGGIVAGESLGSAVARTGVEYPIDGASLDECFFVGVPGLEAVSVQAFGAPSDRYAATIAAIYVRDPAITTPSGLHVGSSYAEVVARLGDQLEERPHEYGGPEDVYLDFRPRDAEDQLYSMRFVIVDGSVALIQAGLASATTLVEGCA